MFRFAENGRPASWVGLARGCHMKVECKCTLTCLSVRPSVRLPSDSRASHSPSDVCGITMHVTLRMDVCLRERERQREREREREREEVNGAWCAVPALLPCLN